MEPTVVGDDGVDDRLAGIDDHGFLIHEDSVVRDGPVDVRNREGDDLGFVPGGVDGLEIDGFVVEQRHAVRIRGPFAGLADPVQRGEQFHIVRERGGERHLIDRSVGVRRDADDRRRDGIPFFRDVDRQRQIGFVQAQRVVHSGDGQRFSETERSDRVPRRSDRDRGAELGRAAGERVEVASARHSRIHGECQRVVQRPLNDGKIVHERFAARGRPGQVEIKDRVVGGNDRAVRKRHPSGQSALAVNEQTAAFCDIDIRHCAAAVEVVAVDKRAAAGVDGNIVRRTAIDIETAITVNDGIVSLAAVNSNSASGIDQGIVRHAAGVDLKPAAKVDGRVVCETAVINVETTVPVVERSIVRHAAVINVETTVPVDIRFIDNRAGVDRRGRIGKNQPADRICRKRRVCAVLKCYITAVFDEFQRRSAGSNGKCRAGIDRVTGNKRILDLERAAARCSLDIGVRGNDKVKIRTVIGDDTRRRAAGNNMKPAAGTDRGMVRNAAGIDVKPAIRVDRGAVRRTAVIDIELAAPVDNSVIDNCPGVDRGGRIRQDQPADRIRRERRVCAVLDCHIAAVLDELHRRSAGSNGKCRAGIDRAAGNKRILDLEHAAARGSLDIGVRRNSQVKVRAVRCDDVCRSAATGDNQPAVIADIGPGCRAAGEDERAAVRIDGSIVRHAAGDNPKITSGVDRNMIRCAAGRDEQSAVPVDCDTVHRAAGDNERSGIIDRGTVHFAAVVNAESTTPVCE